MKLLIITVCGGIGSLLRYLLSGWCQQWTGGTFPSGTLAVNLIGCLLIGLSGALFFGPHMVRDEYRLAVMVGLLGGFTTFSSFAWESLRLIEDREVWLALANIAVSNVLGLFAAWAGHRAGLYFFGA